MKYRTQSRADSRVPWRATTLASILLLACGGTPSETSLLEPIVVDSDDVRVVGTSLTLARIEDLLPVADGAVWALNSTDPYLVLLSSTGQELRVHGNRGEGPGEFSWPSTLVRDPSTNDVWAYDAGFGRLVRIPEPGEQEDSTELSVDPSNIRRLNSYEYLWMNNGGRTWIEGSDDGFIFGLGPTGQPWILSMWHTDIVRLDMAGNREVLLATTDVVGEPHAHFPGATRFLPYPMWTGCPDGSLAVYDPAENTVERLTQSGVRSKTHTLPPAEQRRITASRIYTTVYPGILRNRLMADPPEPSVFRDLVRRDYQSRQDEFAEVFPEYVHLDCSQPDTLWLQRFDTEAGQIGRGPSWLRISADGRVREVRFPADFRPLRFEGDRVWGVHSDEHNVEHAAWTTVSAP